MTEEAQSSSPRRSPWSTPVASAVAALVLLCVALIWALQADGFGAGGRGGAGAGDAEGGLGAAAVVDHESGPKPTGPAHGGGVQGDDKGEVKIETGPPPAETYASGPTPETTAEAETLSAPTEVIELQPLDELPKIGFAEIDRKNIKLTDQTQQDPGISGKYGLGHSIFDKKGAGADIVYVIDRSGSMAGSRIATAKFELIKSLHKLTESQRFYIIFFDDRAIPMAGSKLLSGTETNKNHAIDWLEGIRASGNTDPTAAVLMALSLKPSTIWLLTDGDFDPAVCQKIKQHNPETKTTINTIAFYNAAGATNLRRIARENRGSYRFITEKKRKKKHY